MIFNKLFGDFEIFAALWICNSIELLVYAFDEIPVDSISIKTFLAVT